MKKMFSSFSTPNHFPHRIECRIFDSHSRVRFFRTRQHALTLRLIMHDAWLAVFQYYIPTVCTEVECPDKSKRARFHCDVHAHSTTISSTKGPSSPCPRPLSRSLWKTGH